MTSGGSFERDTVAADPRGNAQRAIYPQSFSIARAGANVYLAEPNTRRLAAFFEGKGLAQIKEEDRREQWYEDWLAYQHAHRIYASVLSPKEYSTASNGGFDLLRYARLLEVFAYFSPAHGYSLQVTFLGLVSILMGTTNAALKREAVAALEAGGLLAFGVSEQRHGADLLANEFALKEADDGRFTAAGTKYYIGNANFASIVSILGRKERAGRPLPVMFALRPKVSPGFKNTRRIHTLGVRAAYVGAFEVTDHELPETDVIAEGRDAWDAVIGTVTLGKFFLGFGSIGICEHAFEEAADHLRGRTLYGKSVIEMPHIRSGLAQAYARLTAMKLYAYRALDYVHAARADDRRYILFCAVQKAKVSTEGVKVVALLADCAGAKAFEADTYLEMALRDAQLIPGLEGSAHINLGTAAQFIPRYFAQPAARISEPASLSAGEASAKENAYLMQARTGSLRTIAFAPFLGAYRPLRSIANVRRFARQAKSFERFVRAYPELGASTSDTEMSQAMGRCTVTIAYGQLVAENAIRLGVPLQLISAIFHLLVTDLSTSALALASLPEVGAAGRVAARRMVSVPRSTRADWDFVAARMSEAS